LSSVEHDLTQTTRKLDLL